MAQNLAKGQMRADKAQRPAVLGEIQRTYGAAVAMAPGKVDQDDRLDLREGCRKT